MFLLSFMRDKYSQLFTGTVNLINEGCSENFDLCLVVLSREIWEAYNALFERPYFIFKTMHSISSLYYFVLAVYLYKQK